MKTAYISVSTYNFNTIFETESISPKSYYKKRNYGNHLFIDTPIDEVYNNDYLFLYEQPPYIADDNVMFLSIDMESLEKDLVKEVGVGVFSYPKTIYFNPKCFCLLFLNENQLQETVIYSQSFTTVKANRYRNLFKILKLEEQKNYDIPVQLDPNTHIQKYIKNDNFFNHFKGLIYGLVLGDLTNSKPTVESELLKLFKNILGAFTSVKSQLMIKESQKDSFLSKKAYEKPNKFYQNPNIDSSESSKKELFSLIKLAENLYYKTFPQELENYQNTLKMLKPEVERFSDLMRTQKAHIFQIDDFQLVGDFLILNPFEQLNCLLREYFNLQRLQISLNSDFSEIVVEKFKTAVTALSRHCQTLFSQQFSQNQPKQFLFSDYLTISKDDGHIVINAQKMGISEQENAFLEIINEVIFNEEMKRANPSELTVDEKLKIITAIGQTEFFQKNHRSSDLHKNMRQLYKYFKEFAEFQIENQLSEVLKNFACFLVKSDNLEELIKYLETKRASNKQIGVSLWCAYNGFASIAESSIISIQKGKIDIDTYLSKVYFSLELPFKYKEEYPQSKTLNLVSKITDIGNNLINSLWGNETKSKDISGDKIKENFGKLLKDFPQYEEFLIIAFEKMSKSIGVEEQKEVFRKSLKGNRAKGISFDTKLKERLIKQLFNE